MSCYLPCFIIEKKNFATFINDIPRYIIYCNDFVLTTLLKFVEQSYKLKIESLFILYLEIFQKFLNS